MHMLVCMCVHVCACACFLCVFLCDMCVFFCDVCVCCCTWMVPAAVGRCWGVVVAIFWAACWVCSLSCWRRVSHQTGSEARAGTYCIHYLSKRRIIEVCGEEKSEDHSTQPMRRGINTQTYCKACDCKSAQMFLLLLVCILANPAAEFWVLWLPHC